jgi:alpha-ribazole phosphatase
MHLYLVRHPQPLVASDVCYGSTDLTVAPQEHARVASALTATLPKGAALFSSPLRRCAELAERLVDPLRCAMLKLDARLVEMHFGGWELRAWNDIARCEIDAWANDLVAYRPGGGESVMQMAERVRAFHADVLSTQQDCIVICHAGTIRMLLACQRNLSPAEMAQYAAQERHKIAYGEVIVLDC